LLANGEFVRIEHPFGVRANHLKLRQHFEGRADDNSV